MKRFLLLCLYLSAISETATSQSLRFLAPDTTIRSSLGEVITYDAPVKNTGSDTLYFYIKRTLNDLPPEWSSSFCFDQNCYATMIDSVCTSPDFSSLPVPPDSTKLFALHVFSQIFPGSATVKVKAVNMRNPAHSATLTLKVNAFATETDDERPAPGSFHLFRNYPNPFNPSTTLEFELPREGFVTLRIFDALGKEVSMPVQGVKPAGMHAVVFSAPHLSSGIYFAILRAGRLTQTRKMILLR